MLEQITPVLLTYNEEENIGRTLERLNWASDIVVVDSYSTDMTLAIARRNPQVRLFQRSFDSHAQQWNFAIENSGIKTEWILALDADYVLTEEVAAELARLHPEGSINGYSADFRYCVLGQPLRVVVEHVPMPAQGGVVEQLGALQDGESVLNGVVCHRSS